MSFWDERYAADTYYYGTEPNDFLRAQAAMIAARGTVLCLGEGEGRNAVFLAGLGYTVVALDQSSTGLEKARRLAEKKSVRIETLVGNLNGYRFQPGRWDGIVSIWCHLPNPMRASIHRQVMTGLKPGGVFLLEAYAPQQLRYSTGGPKDPELLASITDLRRDLEGMEIITGTETERVVQEGAGHTGLSAVVQIVARRPA